MGIIIADDVITFATVFVGSERHVSNSNSSVIDGGGFGVCVQLLGLVYAGLVILVLGVEAGLEVVDERGRRRHELAHHVRAGQQQPRARSPARARARAPGRGLQRRRGGGAPLAPLRDLAFDVERAALGAAVRVSPCYNV